LKTINYSNTEFITYSQLMGNLSPTFRYWKLDGCETTISLLILTALLSTCHPLQISQTWTAKECHRKFAAQCYK